MSRMQLQEDIYESTSHDDDEDDLVVEDEAKDEESW